MLINILLMFQRLNEYINDIVYKWHITFIEYSQNIIITYFNFFNNIYIIF